MILKENNIKTKRGCIHEKNVFISILSCFVFIFALASETHASEHPNAEVTTDAEVTASTKHVAGVVTGYVGSIIGHGYPKYPNEQYNTVAVHQKSSISKDPIFPFGTSIHTDNSFNLNGYGNKRIFRVTDTGDLDRDRDFYWFDVYFGVDSTANYKNATDFGEKNKNVAYTAY